MHYYNNPIIDIFFDAMKKISDKYNLGMEDGFAISKKKMRKYSSIYLLRQMYQ